MLPNPAESMTRSQRGPTQVLKMKQVPHWAEMGLLLAFKRGALLASCEVQRSGTTDLGEKALHLNAVHNNNGNIWQVTFQSI